MEIRVYQTDEEIRGLTRRLAEKGQRLMAFGIEDYLVELDDRNLYDSSYVQSKNEVRKVFPSHVSLHLTSGANKTYVTVNRVVGTSLKPVIVEIEDTELADILQKLLQDKSDLN